MSEIREEGICGQIHLKLNGQQRILTVSNRLDVRKRIRTLKMDGKKIEELNIDYTYRNFKSHR